MDARGLPLDAERFDVWTRSRLAPRPRRAVLGLLAAGIGGALAGAWRPDLAAAGKKGKGKQKKKLKEACSGTKPSCNASDCEVVACDIGPSGASRWVCASRCIECETCFDGACFDDCTSHPTCEQCDATSGRCVSTCPAGESCCALDSGPPGTCFPPCPDGQPRDPLTCTCGCPAGTELCGFTCCPEGHHCCSSGFSCCLNGYTCGGTFGTCCTSYQHGCPEGCCIDD